MEDNNLKSITTEIIDDLQNKINEISKYADSVSEDKKKEANELRNKAITVLTKAGNKLVEAAKNIDDIDDFKSGLDLIKNKSKNLYDEVINRIDAIKNDENVSNIVNDIKNDSSEITNYIKDDIKDLAQAAKSSIEEFSNREDVKNTVNKVKEATSDVADKALVTLKDWLKS